MQHPFDPPSRYRFTPTDKREGDLIIGPHRTVVVGHYSPPVGANTEGDWPDAPLPMPTLWQRADLFFASPTGRIMAGGCGLIALLCLAGLVG